MYVCVSNRIRACERIVRDESAFNVRAGFLPLLMLVPLIVCSCVLDKNVVMKIVVTYTLPICFAGNIRENS